MKNKGKQNGDSINKKVEASQKTKRLSDFDLAEIYLKRNPLIKIDGELHYYNGKYYQALRKQDLESSVLSVLFEELRHGRAQRFKSISTILNAMQYYDYYPAEYDGWLGFENGLLNTRNDYFINFDDPQGGMQAHILPNTYILNGISYFQPQKTLPTPKLDRFFYEISDGDNDLVQRMWEAIGYILVPDTDGRAFFLLQGPPRSGKSVFGRFLESFFPRERITALDISRLGGQFLPDAITKSCLNLSMDLPDQPLSSSAIANVKMITGNDLSVQEAKYKDARPYRSHCKLLFSTNHPLRLRQKDAAFLERIICLPFRNSISQESENTNLLNELIIERESAAMKALCYYWELKSRNYQFCGSERIKPEITYRLAPKEVIQEFINRCCEFVPYDQGKTFTRDLYEAYAAFCNEEGYLSLEIKGFSQMFSSSCGDRVIHRRWRANGEDNMNGYEGVVVINSNAVSSLYENPNYPFRMENSFDSNRSFNV